MLVSLIDQSSNGGRCHSVFVSFAWVVSMVNSLADILSQVLGWMSIVCVGGLAVVFSLLVLFFRLNNEDAQLRRYSGSYLECLFDDNTPTPLLESLFRDIAAIKSSMANSGVLSLSAGRGYTPKQFAMNPKTPRGNSVHPVVIRNKHHL